MKLGGWQRLWILLSVIWLLPVALFTLEYMRIELTPKISPYEERRHQATVDLIRKEASLDLKVADGTIVVNVPKGISKEDLEQLYARRLERGQAPEKQELDFYLLLRPDARRVPPWRFDRPLDPFHAAAGVRRLQEEYGKWIDFSEIESRYKKNLRPLRWEKAKIGMYGVLAWLTSIGLLYLLGATIGWIVRGFKTK